MTVKVGIARISEKIGDFDGNHASIVGFPHCAVKQGADIAPTPEFFMAGYLPEDLLPREVFYAKSAEAFRMLTPHLAASDALKDVLDCFAAFGGKLAPKFEGSRAPLDEIQSGRAERDSSSPYVASDAVMQMHME